MFRTEIKDLVSHMCCFPDSFSQVPRPQPPEEPRMVLVGRGEMIPGDPESKGIHTHLPDRNYSIHLHFSHFRKDLKWFTHVTTLPPEELAKGNNDGNTRGGQLTLLLRESLEIPASPTHSPLGFWEPRQERKVLHLDGWGSKGQTLALEDKTSRNALVSWPHSLEDYRGGLWMNPSISSRGV